MAIFSATFRAACLPLTSIFFRLGFLDLRRGNKLKGILIAPQLKILPA